MRAHALRLAVVLLTLVAFPGTGAAQEGTEPAADTVYHLVLTDGSSFYGTIESQTADRVVFVTTGGARLGIERSQIRVLEPAAGRVVNGEVWPSDPNSTRLFFGPTGRSLPAGEGYVGLFELFFSFGAYGLGDNVVLAGGTPVLPEVIGRVFYVAPKLRVFSTGNTDLAVGALAFFVTEALDEGSLGIVYGVGTIGDDADNALTFGAGWGFAIGNAEAALSDEPVFLVGAEVRTSARIKVITENYLVLGTDSGGLLSAGFRFMGDRFSADLGAGGVISGSDTFCCLPVLSASYTF